MFDTERSITLKNRQFSEEDTLVLSETRRSIAYSPDDAVNEVLNAEVFQNISRKFDVSSSHMSPVNQALWRTFMNSCTWAPLYLSRDDEDFKCTIQNMDMRKIDADQQPQILWSGNLRTGISSGLGKWSVEKLRWIKSLFRDSHQKCMCSAIQLCVVAGSVNNILLGQSPEYPPHYESTDTPVKIVWEIYLGKNNDRNPQCIKNRWEEERTQRSQSQDTIIFMSIYNNIEYWKRMTRMSVEIMQKKSPIVHETSKQDVGHSLDLEKRKSGMEAWQTKSTENGTPRRRLWCKNRLRVGTLYSFPMSRVLKRKKGKDSIHYNGDPISADTFMKTIVSLSELSIYRATLIWYLEKRSEGDNISPTTDFNISQELVTKLPRHDTSELYYLASRGRSLLTHKKNFNGIRKPMSSFSRGKFHKKCRSGTSICDSAILLDDLSGIFRPAWWPWCRHARCVGKIIPFSGPSTVQKSHCNMDDTALRCWWTP